MLNILEASSIDYLESLTFRQIAADLKSGEKVILVVPAQASLSVEKRAFEVLSGSGFFDLRIVRGKKLYDEIMHECGYPGLTSINTVGRSMILRRIAKQNKEQLAAFGLVATENGFIDLCSDFILQLKQNDMCEKDLDELISSSEGLLKGKLSDMRLMYHEYEKALSGKFTDSEDMLEFVTNKVKNSKLISEHKIYYYGFYSFTQREIKYLSEIEKNSRGLSVAFECGRADNFEITKQTAAKLKNAMPDVVFTMGGEEELSVFQKLSGERMHVVNCANPFSMAESIALDIRRLIREKGYTYSDFAVYCGDSPQIISTVKKVFASYDIPLFADEKRSILHNNAVEAVISLLNIVKDDFLLTDVVRFCKSGILDLRCEDIESFAVYAGKYHIKGEKFHQPFKYGKDAFSDTFDSLEQTREMLSKLLKPFSSDMEAAASVSEKLKCLYAFLEDELHLSDKLDSLAVSQAEEGFVDAAEESTQVFDALIGIMEQMDELIGGEAVDIAEFSDIFLYACRDVKVGVLPQAKGRVSLGQIGRSIAPRVKAMYIAGFNDGLIPKDTSDDGVLTYGELKALSSKGVDLSKSADILYDESMFSLFRTLSSCSDYLWMGCLLADQNGQGLKPSILLSEIRKACPDINVQSDISASEDDSIFLEGRDAAKKQLTKVLRDSMDGKPLPDLWQHVYNEVKDDSPELVFGLKYKNKQKPLGKDLAKSLYCAADDYRLSPSRMDGYASCPFKHFVHYGLRPSEIKEFNMGGSEVGIVYHEVLMRLCKDVEDWEKLSDKELEERIDNILRDIAENRLDGILLSGRSQLYTGRRIKNVCMRFAKHMAEEIRSNSIDRMYLESRFSKSGTFPPIEISTSSGKVYIEGQIDRVDVCDKDGKKYIRVIDYKSGNTKFSKKLVEAGLQLQLMVYLKAADGALVSDMPGGVYYFSIKDPQVSASLEELPAEEISEAVLKEIKKAYKLDGTEVDAQFKEQFAATLTGLCDDLIQGKIDISPKHIGSLYDSCTYCEYAGICLKDIS